MFLPAHVFLSTFLCLLHTSNLDLRCLELFCEVSTFGRDGGLDDEPDNNDLLLGRRRMMPHVLSFSNDNGQEHMQVPR